MNDLLSICCRAKIEWYNYPVKGTLNASAACAECGEKCEAIRPDSHPPAFDPPREKWIKKSDFIFTDAVAKAAKDSRELPHPGPADPLEPRL